MTQDQLIQAYMDEVELRLLQASLSMAEIVARRVYSDHMVWPDVKHLAGSMVTEYGLPGVPGVAQMHEREARLKLEAYERWLASNGPIKRATSEFVRSQRFMLNGRTVEETLYGGVPRFASRLPISLP